MHNPLHPRDYIYRSYVLYVSRKDGGKVLASFENSVDASIQ